MTIHHRDIENTEATESGEDHAPAMVPSEAERRAYVSKWIAKRHKAAAAALGTAFLFLPAVAGAQTGAEGLVNAAGIAGVQDVELLSDGGARLTLENGRVLNVSAQDVVVTAAGEVMVTAQVAEIVVEVASVAAGAGAGTGLGAGAAAGAVGVAGIAAAAGGGDGGGGNPAVVLNAGDVAGATSLADIFGANPDSEADRVIVTLEGATEETVNAVKDGDGNWSLPANFTTQEGEFPITYSAEQDDVDDEGNPIVNEVDTGSAKVLIDTTPPTIAIDGPIAGDDVVNAAEQGQDLTIKGTTNAEDGQEVTVTVGGETYTATANGGAWSVTVPAADMAALADGDTINVTADIEDAAGNPATQGTASFDTDFTAPSVAIDTVAGNDELSKINEANGVTITGTTDAEDGQEVTVTFNGETYIGTAASGAWTVSVPAADIANLDTGDTPSVTATVSDAAGNPVTVAAARNLTVDLTGPSLTIDPIAGDDIINMVESGSDVTISGTASGADGQTVTVTIERTDPNSIPTILTANDTADAGTGAWSVTLDAADAGSLLDGGGFSVFANVTDSDGVPAPEVERPFTTDYTAPTIAIITPIAGDGVLNIGERATDLTIEGTTNAENGQEVTVGLNGETYTGTVSGGTWSVTVPAADMAALADADTINVTADVADAAGNPATQGTASFDTDFTAPTISVGDLAGLAAGGELTAGALVDNAGDDLAALTVNGTSSAIGKTVTVTIGTAAATGIVAGDGTWSADFTPATLRSELSGEASFTVSADVDDDAGNTGSASLSLDVDLSLPEITIDDPADNATLGLDEYEGGLDVSGTTSTVPDGKVVTVHLVDGSDTVLYTLTPTVTGGAWSTSFDASSIAALTDEAGYTLKVSVNNGDYPVDATDSHALSSDFQPEISMTDFDNEGVLILADIDPNNVSVDGTTRGVEAGENVTVTILDDSGATFFTDTATVGADGAWSLAVPSGKVGDLEAGVTYDVQADVTNATGRVADTAEQQAVAYEAAQTYLIEDGSTGTQATMQIMLDPRTELPNDNGFALGETLTFDTAEITYLASPAPVYGTGLTGFTNASGAASGELGLGAVGFLNSFDVNDDFVVQFAMNLETSSGVIQMDVDSTEGGHYSSMFGTNGDDSIAANNVDTVVRGRGGDDALDLSGAGVNTVLFEADPAANGADTVTGFSIGGPLPDRMGFTDLNHADLRGDGSDFEVLSGGGTVGANTGLIVFTTAMADLSDGAVRTAIDGLTGPADGDVLYFMASDGTDAQLYEVQVQAGDDTVTDMALFGGLGDLSGGSQANILGFDSVPT